MSLYVIILLLCIKRKSGNHVIVEKTCRLIEVFLWKQFCRPVKRRFVTFSSTNSPNEMIKVYGAIIL